MISLMIKFFKLPKMCIRDSVLIAPFSTLGPASEWGEEQWEELVRSLPGRPVLVALEEDRARASALAERLQAVLSLIHI